jgi:hypothetical protein
VCPSRVLSQNNLMDAQENGMVTFFDHEIEAPTEFVTQRGTPRSQETSRTILRQKRRRGASGATPIIGTTGHRR